MTYVATPDDSAYPWYLRWLFRRQRRRYGGALEPARLWGRIPGAFVAMSLLYRTIDRKAARIEPKLRSLIQVQVSQINGCEFCDDLNSSLGLERGVAPEKIRQLVSFEDSDLFDAREKTALRYAETVTRTGRRVDAELMSGLRRHFEDDSIVELAALIAFQNMSSKFNAALGVPAQGFCAASLRAPSHDARPS